jgi:23S rRNA G2445 N2-methylase RlmL
MIFLDNSASVGFALLNPPYGLQLDGAARDAPGEEIGERRGGEIDLAIRFVAFRQA